MSKRTVQTVILCEDLQHEVFIYRFLRKTGRVNRRNFAALRCPKGRGCGAQYVMDHFAEEVRAYRSKFTYLNLCLIIVIDADQFSVEERTRQLEKCLEAAGQAKRTVRERIIILIPKRNIETWIRYLDGQDFDETTAYDKLNRESECHPVADRLAQLYTHGPETNAPDSLLRAFVESERCTT